MKERPILFSAPMVRAILEGRKTQTRRIVKPQPDRIIGKYPAIDDFGDLEAIHCPYGQPGDRLWVRETWAINHNWDSFYPDTDMTFEDMGLFYRSDENTERDTFGFGSHGKWRPSIHMPRAASRILLEVQDVRIERLQDISENDAIAEGVKEGCFTGHYVDYADQDYQFDNAKDSFRSLWQSIHGPESWDANPWVWVVTFKLVQV